MTNTEITALIQQELPKLLAEDPSIRDFILRTVSDYYADRTETDGKFDRILAELERDRQEQAQKWAENSRQWAENSRQWAENSRQLERDRQEQAQKWAENSRQWEQQHQHNQEVLAELQQQSRRYESTIGALGSRWGLYSEASFRNALKGILEDSFGVEVFNLNDFDEDGDVFGRPDQVEIDIIVKNGLTIVCEIKSSMSKSDLYSFDRKVTFYQKRHRRTVNRKLVISPMVDARALPVAEALGIEIYSYAEAIENL